MTAFVVTVSFEVSSLLTRRRPLLLGIIVASLASTTVASDGGAGPPCEQPAGCGASGSHSGAPLSPEMAWKLREEAREVFYHSYDAYMEHAYPWDELKPLSCAPRRYTQRERGDLDDALLGVPTTLIDSLDTLVVLGDFNEFRKGVELVQDSVHFDRNVTVSVFEATIRVLGGLLSAHILGDTTPSGLTPAGDRWYQGRLLEIALDLGHRLLPAFDTPTGLPIHRINLRHGVLPRETAKTCTAAAGSLLVEFGLLSRLSGEPDFELAARRAVEVLWSQRSAIGLVGAAVDAKSGKWLQAHTGVGAGVDSYYEYLLKAHIILGDTDLLGMFAIARRAANEHLLTAKGLHGEVDMNAGKSSRRHPYVSALQAFWPALEVLAGDIARAEQLYFPLFEVWSNYEALPDVWDVAAKRPLRYARDSPLRPELIESTYFLYSATKDASYLHRGAMMLRALQRKCKVQCGFASIADVATGRLDDRMDSYFLAETAKYLFMLFDMALRDAIEPQRAPELADAERTCTAGASCRQTNSSTPSSTWHTNLIARSRNGRSRDGSVPVDLSKTIFTTEGHIIVMGDGWDAKVHRRAGLRGINSALSSSNGRKQRAKSAKYERESDDAVEQLTVADQLCKSGVRVANRAVEDVVDWVWAKPTDFIEVGSVPRSTSTEEQRSAYVAYMRNNQQLVEAVVTCSADSCIARNGYAELVYSNGRSAEALVADFGPPIPSGGFNNLTLAVLLPFDGCTALAPGHATARAAVVSRGGCSFATKASVLRSAGFSLVIVLDDAYGQEDLPALDRQSAIVAPAGDGRPHEDVATLVVVPREAATAVAGELATSTRLSLTAACLDGSVVVKPSSTGIDGRGLQALRELRCDP